jgi:hypothetical protein
MLLWMRMARHRDATDSASAGIAPTVTLIVLLALALSPGPTGRVSRRPVRMARRLSLPDKFPLSLSASPDRTLGR